MIKLRRAVSSLLLLSLMSNTVLPVGAQTNVRADSHDATTQQRAPAQPRGLRFRLSEGATEAERPPRPVPVAPAMRLSDAETERMLARCRRPQPPTNRSLHYVQTRRRLAQGTRSTSRSRHQQLRAQQLCLHAVRPARSPSYGAHPSAT